MVLKPYDWIRYIENQSLLIKALLYLIRLKIPVDARALPTLDIRVI